MSLDDLRFNLRRARLRKKLTQSDVADAAGMRRDSYNRIERGAESPSLRTLDRIAAALGTTAGKLIDRSSREP